MEPQEICQDEQRRNQVRRRSMNGIDYLEVSEDQLTLTVYFLGKAPEDIRIENVVITGGRRVRDIEVLDVQLCILSAEAMIMKVTVDKFAIIHLHAMPGDGRRRASQRVSMPVDTPPVSILFPGQLPQRPGLQDQPVWPPERPAGDLLARLCQHAA
jgi:hypothetical protein